MRLLVFYSGYLPGKKYGGPVTSLYNFTELLGDENDIYIVCSDHDLGETVRYPNIKDGWNNVGKASVYYLSNSDYSKLSFFNAINEIQPDIIYISSLFSARQTLPVLSLAKQLKIPVLLAPRGELNNNALSLKKTKKQLYLLMLKLLNLLNHVYYQATSIEEKANIVQNLKAKEQFVFLLPNIPGVPSHKSSIDKEVGKLRICFVGRIVKNKNLHIAIEAASNSPHSIILDVYGPLEDQDYYNFCNNLIEDTPNNVSISFKGALSQEAIKNVYHHYDCLISPTEFENYGQAIVEALLHDLPVIISKNTTPWDEVQAFKAGYTVPIDDTNAFTDAINYYAGMGVEEYLTIIENVRSYCDKVFNFEKMQFDYSAALLKIMNNGE